MASCIVLYSEYIDAYVLHDHECDTSTQKYYPHVHMVE